MHCHLFHCSNLWAFSIISGTNIPCRINFILLKKHCHRTHDEFIITLTLSPAYIFMFYACRFRFQKFFCENTIEVFKGCLVIAYYSMRQYLASEPTNRYIKYYLNLVPISRLNFILCSTI